MDQQLTAATIDILRDKYGDRLTYLYCDFIGALNSIEKLYDKPAFNYHKLWKGNKPLFTESIFDNIDLIVAAIDKNLPALPRIQEHSAAVAIAFCRNLWLHELLLCKSWRKDKEKKRDYLSYAFQEIFRDFDTKAVSNFEIEFLPYDMPWASVAYHPVCSQYRPEREKEIYHNFYKTAFLAKQHFHTSHANALRRDDALNYALRIANKLKDYKRKTLYADINNFKLYSEFLKFIDDNKPSPVIKDALYSFLYYEFKRAIIWNSAFLLAVPEFCRLIDSLRGQPVLEGLREQDPQQRERLFRRFVEKAARSLPNALEEDGDLSIWRGISEPTGFYHLKPEAASLAEWQENLDFFERDTAGKYVYQDLNTFKKEWSQGLGDVRAVLLFDNWQSIDEQGIRVITEFNTENQKVIGFKTINRDSEAEDSIPVISEQSPLPALPATGSPAKVVRYLYELNGFNEDIAKLLAEEALEIAWSDQDWEILGQQEWVRVRSTNWFFIAKNELVRKIIDPVSLDDMPPECRKSILDYLRCYDGGLKEEAETARLDALCYGFLWTDKETVVHWIEHLLSALKDFRLELVERVLLIGRTHGREKVSKFSFVQKFSREIVKEINSANNEDKLHLGKKRRKKLLTEVNNFCEQEGIQLAVSDECRLLFLEAGGNILKHFNIRGNEFRKFITACEKRKALFSEIPQRYIWFLIGLYTSHQPDSMKLREYLQRFVRYPATNYDEWNRLWEAHARLGDWQKCFEANQELLKLEPNDFKLLSNRIHLFMMLGKPDEAKAGMEEFEKILAGSRDAKKYLLLKGKILRFRGEKDAALRHFENLASDKSLDNKSRAQAWKEYAELLPEDKDSDKLTAFSQALELQTDHIEVIQDVMILHIRQGNAEKAKEVLKKFTDSSADEELSRLLQFVFYLNTGELPQALGEIKLLIKHADSLELCLLQANLHRQSKQYKQALRIVDGLLKNNPKYVPALQLKVELAIQHETLEESRNAISSLESIRPLTERDYLHIGKRYIGNNYYSEAMHWLDKIVGEERHSTKFFQAKGKILFNLGYYKKALKYFTRVLDIEPENPHILHNKGHLFMQCGRHEDALQCFEHAILVEPNAGGRYAFKAHCLILLQKLEEASVIIDEKFSSNAEEPDSLYVKSLYLYNTNKYEDALKYIDKGLSFRHYYGYIDFLNLKEVCLAALGQHEKLIKLVNKQNIHFQNPRYWCGKAEIFREAGLLEKAMEYIELALSYNPDHERSLVTKFSILWAQAKNLWEQRKTDEANKIFKDILKNTDEPDTEWYNRACAHALLKQHEEALSALKKSIDLNPEWQKPARDDTNFDSMRDMPEFQKLTG